MLFADDIDVIDYYSVSVSAEGTRVPKQTVLDFDVHESFLKVKKWNLGLMACRAKDMEYDHIISSNILE